MDCRVVGNQVEPVRWRMVCDVTKVFEAYADETPTDDGTALLAFSDAERDEIAGLLTKAGIAYRAEATPQPDAARLARLNEIGAASRDEALAHLAAYWLPCTEKQADLAGLRYNLTAKGVIAHDEAERDAAATALAPHGAGSEVQDATGPPPTAAELEARVAELEARSSEPSQ